MFTFRSKFEKNRVQAYNKTSFTKISVSKLVSKNWENNSRLTHKFDRNGGKGALLEFTWIHSTNSPLQLPPNRFEYLQTFNFFSISTSRWFQSFCAPSRSLPLHNNNRPHNFQRKDQHLQQSSFFFRKSKVDYTTTYRIHELQSQQNFKLQTTIMRNIEASEEKKNHFAIVWSAACGACNWEICRFRFFFHRLAVTIT